MGLGRREAHIPLLEKPFFPLPEVHGRKSPSFPFMKGYCCSGEYEAGLLSIYHALPAPQTQTDAMPEKL